MSIQYENSYATKVSGSVDSSKSTYQDIATFRSTIAPRQLIIQRSTRPTRSLSRPNVARSEVFLQQSMLVPTGAYANMTSSGIQSVVSSRDQEKKDMQDLNDRFANFIEKTRFLEVQNKDLSSELEKLKARWGKETTQIKAMYQAELDEARRLLDETEKEKAYLSIRVATLEEDLEEFKQKNGEALKDIDDLRLRVEQLSGLLNKSETDVGPLRRRNEALEAEKVKDQKIIDQLREALNTTRINLDNETLLHVDAENRRQTLEEEIEFLKQVHEQELKELAALAYRDPTLENREFWKHEMGQALREIREVYDNKIDAMRSDLESYYSLKVQEFTTKSAKGGLEADHAKNEVKRLKEVIAEGRNKNGDLEYKYLALQREFNELKLEREDRQRELEEENNQLKMEVAKLRAEMEAILKELQAIIDTKLGLELEIAAYRKLLEGEETRVGLRQFIDKASIGKGKFTLKEHYTGSDSNVFTTRVSASSPEVFKKSAGHLKISESASDGTFVLIENIGFKTIALAGYKISKEVDGKVAAEFAFPKKASMKTGESIKIWAKNHKASSGDEEDLESSFNSWGVGETSLTRVFDNKQQEVASMYNKS